MIVNYNGAHLLARCLDALDRQREDAPPFETVVVDNASIDESRRPAGRTYPWVRVIASSTNPASPAATTWRCVKSRRRSSLLLNNDATPQPGWLKNLLAPFAAGDPTLGMITGKIVFMPSFIAVRFATPGFRPGPHDARELGVRVYAVTVRSQAPRSAPRCCGSRPPTGRNGPATRRLPLDPPGRRILVPVPAERSPPAGCRGPSRRSDGRGERPRADGQRPTRARGTQPSDIE